MRVSEAKRVSEDALFLGEKAMYQAIYVYGTCVMRVLLYMG